MAENPLLREADKWVGRFKTLHRNALMQGQRAVSSSQVRAGIAASSTLKIEQATERGLHEIEKMLKANMPELVLNFLAATGNVAAKDLPVRGVSALRQSAPQARVAPIRFDKKSVEAIRWAERYAASEIIEITDDARKAVRHVIVTGQASGIAPATQAQMIRQSVGLTERYAVAVMNLEQRLREAQGRTVHAGKLTFRVPAKGMTATQRTAAVNKYADRLTRARALNIARTETIKASSEGQHQLWRQARVRGLLDGTEQREWISTAGACDICAGLGGQRAGLETGFAGGTFAPPAHPGCRCTVGLSYA